jgi:segregation and condensation protein B
MLYGTTREFLEFFNLGDLKDLPSLREFHELSEEHQAQVAALESAAPEGSIEPAEGEGEPGRVPLQRVDFTLPAEDPAELEEIDRLIQTAGAVAPAAVDPPDPRDPRDPRDNDPSGEPEL